MRTLLLSLLLLSLLPSFAQSFGIKGGVAFASYSAVSKRGMNPAAPKSNITASFKPGFILGGMADFRLSPNWVLRSGLDIVVKGAEEKGSYHDVNGMVYPYVDKYHFTAFDVPVNLLYKKQTTSGAGLFAGGGLVPGVLIETGLSRFDIGAQVQAGYTFPAGVELGVNYNHGLLNVASTSFDYQSLYNRYAGITVGYRFGKRHTGQPQPVKDPERPDKATVTGAPKVLFAELGGPGGLLSLNYDTRFQKSVNGLGIRFGLGLLFDPYSSGISIPVALNYLAGTQSHFLEVAGGASFIRFKEENQDSWYNFEKESFLAPFAWAGYRYQPLHQKFVFRAGFTQFFGVGMPVFMKLPVPSLSFGYSLR